MEHLDPELLALLALGEDAASARDRLHLAGCAVCRAELRRYTRPVAASRRPEEPLESPAHAVWSGIAAELGVDPGLVADPVGSARPGTEGVDARTAGPSRIRRSRRGAAVVLAAAAVVLVVGGVSVGLLVARPGPQRIATATLEPLPGWQGRTGTAVLERLADGRRVVAVRTSVRPGTTTDHEVWLMAPGAKRLVSLGLLRGEDGVFAVPAGVDLSRFPLVDVSDEPRDGNPAHSGDSIIRGALHS